MNVRFAEHGVRCRVTQAEIAELLRLGTLKLAVALPRHKYFQVTVRAAALGPWQLDSDPTGLWIGIPRSQIVQLSDALPSRAGIGHEFELDSGERVQVSFEVDVRKRHVTRTPSTDSKTDRGELTN